MLWFYDPHTQLFSDLVPNTAEHFRLLCTGKTHTHTHWYGMMGWCFDACCWFSGEKGFSSKTGKPLHYKGTFFHRILKGSMAQVSFTLPFFSFLFIQPTFSYNFFFLTYSLFLFCSYGFEGPVFFFISFSFLAMHSLLSWADVSYFFFRVVICINLMVS